MRQHQICVVEQWRRALRAWPGGRFVARALLPRSNAGIALRVSVAGTMAMWLTVLATA